MSVEGRPLDGHPILAGDIFITFAGRYTTPFPAGNTSVAVERWLAQNALNEARANGDTFNGQVFESMVRDLEPAKAKFRRSLSPADFDMLNMFLWDAQPAPVPSILRPLVS